MPSGSVEPPISWKSRTAESSGIGISSWAWKRTAASISSGLSIAGRRIVRKATRWLPTPSRTSLEMSFLEKASRRAPASSSGSVTSPSWKAPAGIGATTALVTVASPFSRTSAAAMLAASISRPTTERDFPFGLLNICPIRGMEAMGP